jgi:hypothetical protein
MKVSELKETIRAKVRETLYAGPNALPAAMKDPAYNALPPTEKTKVNNALKQKQSVNLEEEDFLDDDDSIIIEDVEDIDDKDPTFKDYDSIYEINANVAPGSRYQIEVSKDGNFIVLTQDNGYEIVVHPDDVRDLVKVILEKYNEAD